MAFKSQPTVTRPANTTAYTAGDVVGGVITFPSVGNFSGHILITSTDLRINVSAVPSGMTSFRLHLYDATPDSAIADNAAWDLTANDRVNYLGYVDLGTPVDCGTTLYVRTDQVNAHFVHKVSPPTTIYGYLVTNGGFTPAGNSEVYVPTLRGIEL